MTYLIAHTVKNGTNVAQVWVQANSETAALAIFKVDYPDRVVIATGVHGFEGN